MNSLYLLGKIFFGIIIGSFLNVCIHRIPRGESIVLPSSHCPKCDTPLKPRDLIPVLSFLLLKGRCRYCGAHISPRYPMVELFNGLLYFILYRYLGLTATFIFYGLLSSLLLTISFIDYDHQIIPDGLVIFGILTGFIYIFWVPDSIAIVNAFMGFALGGGIFLVIAVASGGAMGGGDIKLMAMLGLWLGWKYILLTTLLSFILGAVFSILILILKIKSRKDAIPFGPFISMAAFIVVLYGKKLIEWYLSTIIG